MLAVAAARARWKRRSASEWRLKRHMLLAATAHHESRNSKLRPQMVREADLLVHGGERRRCARVTKLTRIILPPPAGELSERSRCASVRGGEVPEWSIGAVSKAVVLLAGVPWVRIPPSPPAAPSDNVAAVSDLSWRLVLVDEYGVDDGVRYRCPGDCDLARCCITPIVAANTPATKPATSSGD